MKNKPLQTALGIDIGGTNITTALINRAGRIIKVISTSTRSHLGRRHLLDTIKHLVREMLKNPHLDSLPTGTLSGRLLQAGEPVGIGVGLPGSVDAGLGIILAKTPNLPRWQGFPIKQLLESEFNLPTWVENDANLAALGEKWWGNGRPYDNLVCYTIGTGIGGGIIINGQIYNGSFYYAGEVGHIIVDINGPPCKCGSYGCLEVMTAGPAIVRRTRKAIRKTQAPTLIRKLSRGDPDNITAKIVFDAAKRGDKLALNIVSETAYYLGVGISQVVNLLDPQAIIIGGRISLAGEILFRPVRRTVNKLIMPSPSRRLKILPAALGEYATVTGAATLIFQKSGLL